MNDKTSPRGKPTTPPRSTSTRKVSADLRSAKTIRREHKRNALLRAAVSAFNKQGVHQTSLDQIGEKLGLTKAALYYYFPSKSAILAACFARAMRLTRCCLEHAKREGKSGRATLFIFFQRYIEATHEEMEGYFLLTEDYALDPEYRSMLILDRDAVEMQLRKIVKEGIRDGSIVECDPKLAVFLLLGAVNWIPKWFSTDGDWTYRQLAKATAEMLDRMLSVAAAPRLIANVGRIPVSKTHKERDADPAPGSGTRRTAAARTRTT